MASDIIELHASIDGGPERKFVGRFAWALSELVRAGQKGVTPIERPAPRWSHYVFRLRREGVGIATIEEPHGGAYAGRHARYVLSVPVTVVQEVRS